MNTKMLLIIGILLSSTVFAQNKVGQESAGEDVIDVIITKKTSTFVNEINEINKSKQTIETCKKDNPKRDKCMENSLWIQGMYDDFFLTYQDTIKDIYSRIRTQLEKTASMIGDMNKDQTVRTIPSLNGAGTQVKTSDLAQTISGFEGSILKSGGPDTGNLPIKDQALMIQATNMYNDKFSSSLNQLQNRTIYFDDTKPAPRLWVKTRVGPNIAWTNKVTTKNTESGSFVVVNSRYFDAADPKNITDAMIGQIIRENKVLINGIPVDGVDRRNYFNRMLDPECRKNYSKSFKNAGYGPYAPYDKGEPCAAGADGVEIISARLSIDGGKSWTDATQYFSDRYNFKDQPSNTMTLMTLREKDIPLKMPAYPNDYELIEINYACGCGDSKPYRANIKGDQIITLSCK